MSAEEFQGGISLKDEWSAYAKVDQPDGSQNAIHLLDETDSNFWWQRGITT